MKINILRIVLIVMLLTLFANIFNFSNQNGEESSSLSREITENVTKNIESIQKLEPNKKEEVLGKIEHIIRKIAHFSLYTFVGILSMSLMSTYKIKQLKRIGLSLGIGILYAISDEFHQSFVPGRTALFGDIFIDTFGVIFGILIIMLTIKILNNKITLRKLEQIRKNTLKK